MSVHVSVPFLYPKPRLEQGYSLIFTIRGTCFEKQRLAQLITAYKTQMYVRLYLDPFRSGVPSLPRYTTEQ